MEGLLMNAHPSALELRRAYAQRPFSVFAVSRQVKFPGECARYSTIHSAMIFPVRGRARFVLGGECLEGRRGVVLHGCPHKDLLFEAVGDEPFEHINVYYEANSDEAGDPHHWMMRPFDYAPDNYDELMARVEALEALNAAATLDSRLNQIVGATNLLRTMFDSSPRTRADECMARARAYIETHFAEPLCLDDLAARYGMAAQRFSHCFARVHRVRPMNLLISLRLEQAMRLLQTDMRVKDVAHAVGYDDPLYFSRLFKRHYGCSPSEARRDPEQGALAGLRDDD